MTTACISKSCVNSHWAPFPSCRLQNYIQGKRVRSALVRRMVKNRDEDVFVIGNAFGLGKLTVNSPISNASSSQVGKFMREMQVFLGKENCFAIDEYRTSCIASDSWRRHFPIVRSLSACHSVSQSA